MTNEIKICESCGSSNIYGSPNGYDSVIVCRDCHAETHAPEVAPATSTNNKETKT